MRKLKLLAALLAMMAVIVSSTVAPAMARHWDIYDDPWGECGWYEVWDYSYVFERWEFEGYEYDCHRNWPDWDDDDERWDDDDEDWDDDDEDWDDDDEDWDDDDEDWDDDDEDWDD